MSVNLALWQGLYKSCTDNNMIYSFIQDIYKAIKGKSYITALSLALCLPDICGKAEYPNDKTTSRYKKWYCKYIGEFENPNINDNEHFSYCSANVIYVLRNNLFHEGNPTIVNCKNIKQFENQVENQVDHFVLIIDDDMNGGESELTTDCNNNIKDKALKVNIIHLCWLLCICAKAYYDNNQEKFDGFFMCELDF